MTVAVRETLKCFSGITLVQSYLSELSVAGGSKDSLKYCGCVILSAVLKRQLKNSLRNMIFFSKYSAITYLGINCEKGGNQVVTTFSFTDSQVEYSNNFYSMHTSRIKCDFLKFKIIPNEKTQRS